MERTVSLMTDKQTKQAEVQLEEVFHQCQCGGECQCRGGCGHCGEDEEKEK